MSGCLWFRKTCSNEAKFFGPVYEGLVTHIVQVSKIKKCLKCLNLIRLNGLLTILSLTLGTYNPGPDLVYNLIGLILWFRLGLFSSQAH